MVSTSCITGLEQNPESSSTYRDARPKYGRSWAGVGQRVRRATVEGREIRGHLHSRLRGGAGALSGAGPVLRLLQQRTTSSVAGVSDPGGRLRKSRGHEGLTDSSKGSPFFGLDNGVHLKASSPDRCLHLMLHRS